MNRLLVDILSGINALAAGVIIVGSTIIPPTPLLSRSRRLPLHAATS